MLPSDSVIACRWCNFNVASLTKTNLHKGSRSIVYRSRSDTWTATADGTPIYIHLAPSTSDSTTSIPQMSPRPKASLTASSASISSNASTSTTRLTLYLNVFMMPVYHTSHSFTTCPRKESNLHLQFRRLSSCPLDHEGLERYARIELASLGWKPRAQPIYQYRVVAQRLELCYLGLQPSAYPYMLYYLARCKGGVLTAGFSPDRRNSLKQRILYYHVLLCVSISRD